MRRTTNINAQVVLDARSGIVVKRGDEDFEADFESARSSSNNNFELKIDDNIEGIDYYKRYSKKSILERYKSEKATSFKIELESIAEYRD